MLFRSDLAARDRAALLGARLMLVEGRIERQAERLEVPVIHVIARRLIDRTDLLDQLIQAEDATAWGDAGLARANEVRRPDPSSARPKVRMPASRDFR